MCLAYVRTQMEAGEPASIATSHEKHTFQQCGSFILTVYMDDLTLWVKCLLKNNQQHCCSVFPPQVAGLTAGCSWPLMLAVRNGELVERRLSHSLGRGSGTDSMKLLFSSLMLEW